MLRVLAAIVVGLAVMIWNLALTWLNEPSFLA